MQKVKSERIVLDSYAEVLKINDSYQIIIKSLPDGYKIKDIIYSSSNSNAAAVINGNVLALSAGNAQIEVKTSDNKYKSYVNILVSTG